MIEYNQALTPKTTFKSVLNSFDFASGGGADLYLIGGGFCRTGLACADICLFGIFI